MTTYEKLKQEGEIIGLQKGEKVGLQKGASRVLLRQLGKRFPEGTEHLLPLLQELTPEQGCVGVRASPPTYESVMHGLDTLPLPCQPVKMIQGTL